MPIPSEIAAAAARWVARRDAGLRDDEQADLERWLAADPRHRTALAHYARVLSAFEQPHRSGIAPQFVRELGARAVFRRRRRIRTGSALAAAAAVAITAGVWWRSPVGSQKPHTATAVAIMPEKRSLADGSTVELKDGARIAVSFDGAERHVELQAGEAHFQVEKESRPFVVRAGGVEVRAVGTAFSVQLGSQAIEVLVTEGRVAMDTTSEPPTPAAAASPPALAARGVESPEVYVDAGNRAVVNVTAQSRPDTTVVAVSARELAERLAWRSPRLEFSGTPLAEAVALMNRSGGSTDVARRRLVIHPASRQLMAEPVSGTFRADSPEAFARMLELSFGVQVELRGEHEIVLRK